MWCPEWLDRLPLRGRTEIPEEEISRALAEGLVERRRAWLVQVGAPRTVRGRPNVRPLRAVPRPAGRAAVLALLGRLPLGWPVARMAAALDRDVDTVERLLAELGGRVRCDHEGRWWLAEVRGG